MAGEETLKEQPSPIGVMRNLEDGGGSSLTKSTTMTPITQASVGREPVIEKAQERDLEKEEVEAYRAYQTIRELRMKKKKEDEMNRVTVEDYVSDEEGQLQPTNMYKAREVIQPEVRQPQRGSEELEAIRYHKTMEEHNFKSPFKIGRAHV